MNASSSAESDTLAESSRCVALVIARQRPALDRVNRLAAAIRSRLEILFPILDTLCKATCPECGTPCCRRARISFDHPDLIFLHLTGHPVPPLQPRPSPGPPCRYLGTGGCVLPRVGRPWICTWYICPLQKVLLAEDARRTVNQAIAEIKGLRKEMEAAFIQAVV